MACKVSFCILFIFGFFSSMAAHSGSDVTNNEMNTSDETETNSSTNVFTNESFITACQNESDVRDVPRTGLTRRKFPSADTKGILAKDFLQIVLGQMMAYTAQQRNIVERLDFCLRNQMKPPPDRAQRGECQPFLDFAMGPIRNEVKKARFHLALAQSSFDKDWKPSNRLTVSYEPNTDMSVSRQSYKEVPWDPLTKAEHEAATKTLEGYRQHVWSENGATSETFEWRSRGHAKRQRPVRQTIAQEMRYFRDEHLRRYNDTVSEIPLLQHIKSPNPSPAEIQKAAHKVLELTNKELTRLAELSTELTELGDSDTIPPKFFELMDFKAFTEGALLNHPEYCSVATAIVRTKDNRQTGNMAALGLGFLAIGLLPMSPIIMVAVGVGAAAPMTYLSHQDYKQAREQRMAQLISRYEDSQGDKAKDRDNPFRSQSMEQIVNAKNQFHMEVLLAPTALVGSGIIRGGKNTVTSLIRPTPKISATAQRLGGLTPDRTQSQWLNLPRTRMTVD